MFMARVQPRGHATSACHLSMPPQHMPPQPAGASSDPPPTCLPPPLPAAWRRRHSGVHAGQRPPHEVWVWQPRPGQPPVHQLGAREVPGGRAGTAPWPAEEACGERGGDRAGQGGPGLPGIASAVQPRPCLLKLQSVHSCVVGGTQVGVDSPGPSYNLPAGMGRQQVSGRTGWLLPPARQQCAVLVACMVSVSLSRNVRCAASALLPQFSPRTCSGYCLLHKPGRHLPLSPQLSTKKSPGTFVMPKGQRFVDNDVREAAQKVGGRLAWHGPCLPCEWH